MKVSNEYMKNPIGDRFDGRLKTASEAKQQKLEQFKAAANDPEKLAKRAERQALAAAREAKQKLKALEQMREKEASDLRKAQAAERDAAQAVERKAGLETELAATADREIEQNAAREAERKAERDRKYAARRNRKR